MIIAVTGHRPQKLAAPGTEQRVRPVLKWALETLKPQWVITGMALGVDQWMCEEALALGVPVLAAIPCWDQETFWRPEAKVKYHELLGRVQAKEVVSPGAYHAGVMQERNRWMVDRATCVVAIFDGTAGGTANAVTYAIQNRKPVFRYDPKTFNSEWIK